MLRLNQTPFYLNSLLLVVVTDSYMGMFLPEDISQRITQFMDGIREFPFIKHDEIMATFYLFGKDHRVKGQVEILAASDLAKRTIEGLAKDVRIFYNMQSKMDSNFTRDNYIKRALQISIELRNDTSFNDQSEMKKRIAGDPTILSSCFVQHISYYKQDYFFELFQPFKEIQLPTSLRNKLEGRMLLLGYNVKDSLSLPFEDTLTPFIKWISKKNS